LKCLVFARIFAWDWQTTLVMLGDHADEQRTATAPPFARVAVWLLVRIVICSWRAATGLTCRACVAIISGPLLGVAIISGPLLGAE
jgi:hypothetical protein